MENLELNDEVIVYPTTPDAEGWQYTDEGSKVLGIETREDPEGNVFKRVKLSKGRTAIVRELTNREMSAATKIAGKNADKLVDATIAIAATITEADGTAVKFVAEDMATWKARDTNRLQVASQQINF